MTKQAYREIRKARVRDGQARLRYCMEYHKVTGDPLYLWHAYAVADEYGLQPPPLVVQYLRKSAKALTTHTLKTPAQLLDALGLSVRGRGGLSHRSLEAERRMNFIGYYLEQRPGFETPKLAAAKAHVTPDKFRRWVKKYRCLVELTWTFAPLREKWAALVDKYVA